MSNPDKDVGELADLGEAETSQDGSVGPVAHQSHDGEPDDELSEDDQHEEGAYGGQFSQECRRIDEQAD